MDNIKAQLKKKELEAAKLQTKNNFPISGARQIPKK